MEVQKPETRTKRVLRLSGLLISAALTLGNTSCEASASSEAESNGYSRVATFNVRGAHHTESSSEGWDSGRERMETAYDLITYYGIDVIGFQELEKSQREEFLAQSSEDGDYWGFIQTHQFTVQILILGHQTQSHGMKILMSLFQVDIKII